MFPDARGGGVYRRLYGAIGSRDESSRDHHNDVSLDREAEVARQDQSLDLRGALTDFQDFRVAIEAAHRRLVDVAVAAVDLDSLAGRGHRDLARVELRHRRRGAYRLALIAQPRGL